MPSRYTETINMIYSRNSLLFHSLNTVLQFVQSVPAKHLALVKDIHVTTGIHGVEFTKAHYGQSGMQKGSIAPARILSKDYFDVPIEMPSPRTRNGVHGPRKLERVQEDRDIASKGSDRGPAYWQLV